MLALLRVLLMAYTLVAPTGRHGDAAANAMAAWCASERARTGPEGSSAAAIMQSMMAFAVVQANDVGAGAALELTAKGVSNFLDKKVKEDWTRYKSVPGRPVLYVVVPALSYHVAATLPAGKMLVDRREREGMAKKIESLEAANATLEAANATLAALRAENATLPAQRAAYDALRTENKTLRAEIATLRATGATPPERRVSAASACPDQSYGRGGARSSCFKSLIRDACAAMPFIRSSVDQAGAAVTM